MVTCDYLKSGDLLTFSGAGCFSRVIRFKTGADESHIGILSRTNEYDVHAAAGWSPYISEEMARRFRTPSLPLLYESTTLVNHPCRITGEPIKGVQAQNPIVRASTYNGEVSLLRLREPLVEPEQERLTKILLYHLGTPYDGAGAIRCGLTLIHRRPWRLKTEMSTYFCSELVAAALTKLGVLSIQRPALWSPGALVRFLVEANIYFPPEPLKPCLLKELARPLS
jgi:hypothetical protein